ncbi:hypothetical protein LC724_01125 [Blautia sp. RD014234]|nr:hypothetical protein [Blautia parvula]
MDIYRFYFEKTMQSNVGFTQAGLMRFVCSLGYSVVKQSSEEQTQIIENKTLKRSLTWISLRICQTEPLLRIRWKNTGQGMQTRDRS